RRDSCQRIARALGARLGHQVLEVEETDRAAAEGARIGCHGFPPVPGLLSPTHAIWRGRGCIVEKNFGGTMSIRSTFVSLVFAMFAAGVAADAGAQQRREGPCAADVKKFCGDVKPGQGAIAKCMKAHEAELSPACRDGSKARAEKAERVRADCKADAETFCKGIESGAGG